MFKLSKSLQNIKKVCSNDRIAFFLTQSNKIYQDETLIFEGQDISDIRICKNDFYAFGDSTHSYLGDFRNNIIIEIDFVFSSECIWRSGAIINENYRYDTSDGKIKADYYVLDFNTKQKRILLKDLEGRITCLFDGSKKAIYLFKTTLRSLSLLTGEYEWEVDLSKYGDINHILGVIDNELFVWQNRNTIVALNTQTGQALWHINIYEVHQAGDIYGIHFLPEERKVVIFDKIYYIEIDIATRSSSLLFKSAYSKSWEFATSTVSGNYIYFTGRNYATGELSVGVFNRQSLQVEWYYAAPEWQGRVPDDYEGNAVVLNSAPQVSDDKLYVLENGTGTLYIFEKEQST